MNELMLLLKEAQELIPKAWSLARTVSKVVGDKASYDFRTAHQTYCVSVVKNYCRARTFFVRDEPKFLDEFYVPASIVRNGKIRVPKAGLAALQKVSRRVIVKGSGGAGKTIFMRYLLLDAIQTGEKYPVFIELRKLNEASDLNLEETIADFMAEHGFPLGRDFAIQSLNDGLLVVLLDGFDEVSASKRRQVEREIRRIGTKSASQIIVSSRQDSHLEGWDNFSTVEIAPLELGEACELIEKVPFVGEENIKERFVKRLKGGLFESHKYFLSNPLLLSIMLLTYGDSADIPTKFSSFYEQAFSALYQKHDALKSGYKRDRKVLLDILDFGRLFSAFSAITYGKKVVRFSVQDGIGYVDSAKKLMGLPAVSSEGFLEDARQAVCILIEDGLDYAFVHRSFQEYFTARFISEASEQTQAAYISRLVKASAFFEGDNVIQLLYEMNPAIVEEKYLIPEMKKFFGTLIRKKITKDGWKKLYTKLVSEIRYGNQSISYQLKSAQAFNAILFIRRNCFKGLAIQDAVHGDSNALTSALSLAMPGSTSVSPKDISVRSPLWDVIQSETFDFSLVSLENLRASTLALEARSKERAEAEHEIFDFSGLAK